MRDGSANRDRFYELTEAYDQAVITYAANEYLSRTIAELRPHSARLRIIAHSPNASPSHSTSISRSVGRSPTQTRHRCGRL